MKEYEFYVATMYVGSKVKEKIQFEDDITEDELNEYFEEWVWGKIDGGWNEVE